MCSALKKMLILQICDGTYGNLTDRKENITILFNDLDKVHFSFSLLAKQVKASNNVNGYISLSY